MTPAPTVPASRAERLRTPVIVGGALAAASIALHVRNPHQEGSWGICPWRELTGTDCPGCGGLRAVNDLTNFRLVDAASSNLLFIGALPAIAFFYLRSLHDAWFGIVRRGREVSALRWTWLAVGTIVAWWTFRNLPGLEWFRSGPV